jgi:hypothetical protein
VRTTLRDPTRCKELGRSMVLDSVPLLPAHPTPSSSSFPGARFVLETRDVGCGLRVFLNNFVIDGTIPSAELTNLY